MDLEEFKQKYCITDDMIANSGLTWEDLIAIQQDFTNKAADYSKILDEFKEKYLNDALVEKDGERAPVHAIRTRVKNPEHLMAKAVKKKLSNFKKYEHMDADNYERFFTDLAGLRCLLLFKADWIRLHEHLMTVIKNDAALYIGGGEPAVADVEIDEPYHAEEPKVHIRNGDSERVYKNVIQRHQIKRGKTYRSAHYIIRYKGIFIEIQARTLFEESWGEIDHAIVYPYHTKDDVLGEYTKLINRLSGMADEMASFFQTVEKLEELRLKHLNRSGKESIDEAGIALASLTETAGFKFHTTRGDIPPSTYECARNMLDYIVKYE